MAVFGNLSESWDSYMCISDIHSYVLLRIIIDLRNNTCYNIPMIMKGVTKDANDTKGNHKKIKTK